MIQKYYGYEKFYTTSSACCLVSSSNLLAALINISTVSFEELISRANSSTSAAARSITVIIPASLNFLAVVGPTPSTSWISKLCLDKILPNFCLSSNFLCALIISCVPCNSSLCCCCCCCCCRRCSFRCSFFCCCSFFAPSCCFSISFVKF